MIHYKLAAEYREVIDRHRREIPYQSRDIDRFLAALIGVAELIDVRYLLRPNLPDESDNFVMEIAFAASPCTIVTHNVRDLRGGELRWPGVLVKTPGFGKYIRPTSAS